MITSGEAPVRVRVARMDDATVAAMAAVFPAPANRHEQPARTPNTRWHWRPKAARFPHKRAASSTTPSPKTTWGSGYTCVITRFRP